MDTVYDLKSDLYANQTPSGLFTSNPAPSGMGGLGRLLFPSSQLGSALACSGTGADSATAGTLADRVVQLTVRGLTKQHKGSGTDQIRILVDRSNYSDRSRFLTGTALVNSDLSLIKTTQAARVSRVVAPAFNQQESSEFANFLLGFEDSTDRYTYLFARGFALMEALASGWNTNAIPNTAGGFLFTTGVNARAILDHLGASIYGNSPTVLLNTSNSTRPLTAPMLGALATLIQVSCGVNNQVAGHTTGLAGRFAGEAMHVYLYGSRIPQANLPLQPPTLGTTWALLLYLAEVLDDTQGFEDAFSACASSVRFVGPSITNLPTSLDTRFINHQIMGEVRRATGVLREWVLYDLGGYAGPLQCQGLRDAIDDYRRGPQGLTDQEYALVFQGAGSNPNMPNFPDEFRPLVTLLGNSNNLDSVFLQLSSQEIMNYSNLMVQLMDLNRFFGATFAQAQLPATNGIPAAGLWWTEVDARWSVTASHLEGYEYLPCASGLGQIKALAEGVNPRSGFGSLPSIAPNAEIFLSRLYMSASVIRACADAISDSAMMCDAGIAWSYGQFATGSADLDRVLPKLVSTTFFSTQEYFAALNLELNVRNGQNVYLPQDIVNVEFCAMHSPLVSYKCFHPMVATILGDNSVTGGAYSLSTLLTQDLSLSEVQQWTLRDNTMNNEVVDDRDWLALCQVAANYSSLSVAPCQFVSVTDPTSRRTVEHFISYNDFRYVRPSDQFSRPIIAAPPAWWLCYLPLGISSVGKSLPAIPCYSASNAMGRTDDPRDAAPFIWAGNAAVSQASSVLRGMDNTWALRPVINTYVDEWFYGEFWRDFVRAVFAPSLGKLLLTNFVVAPYDFRLMGATPIVRVSRVLDVGTYTQNGVMDTPTRTRLPLYMQTGVLDSLERHPDPIDAEPSPDNEGEGFH